MEWGLESRQRMRRLFLENFSVMDVAEPLVSVDAERPAQEVLELLEARDFDLVGVRVDGLVSGYALRGSLTSGRCGQHRRSFEAADLVGETASLRDAIQSLGANRRCFVTVLGQPAAIVTVSDLEKPPVRMFLFGLITLLEGFMTRELQRRFPDDGWRVLVPASRLAKAEELLAERRRRGQPGRLVDCLQFSDKGEIMLGIDALGGPQVLQQPSRKAAKRALKELETLRNNLAHTQQIIPDGLERIVVFSSRLESLLDAGAAVPPSPAR
jgi:CBS domain-containing protein